jgi:hypothetical protein
VREAGASEDSSERMAGVGSTGGCLGATSALSGLLGRTLLSIKIYMIFMHDIAEY